MYHLEELCITSICMSVTVWKLPMYWTSYMFSKCLIFTYDLHSYSLRNRTFVIILLYDIWESTIIQQFSVILPCLFLFIIYDHVCIEHCQSHLGIYYFVYRFLEYNLETYRLKNSFMKFSISLDLRKWFFLEYYLKTNSALGVSPHV